MTQTDQIMPCVFLLYLKGNDPQTFKSVSRKVFSPVRILLVQLASMNVFHSM